METWCEKELGSLEGTENESDRPGGRDFGFDNGQRQTHSLDLMLLAKARTFMNACINCLLSFEIVYR